MGWKLSEAIAPYLDLNRGLCLVGLVGRGKTTNLCLLARDWLSRWAKEAEISDEEIDYFQTQDRPIESTWRFISFPTLVMEIQDAWRREETEETAFARLKRVANVPRLIIDDLGAEKLTDYVRQATYYLINEREQWDRTTYITSNYPLKELDRQLDSRISSRIAGMCDIKALQGEDLRLRKIPGQML
jgi:DNA replication protein DnaC